MSIAKRKKGVVSRSGPCHISEDRREEVVTQIVKVIGLRIMMIGLPIKVIGFRMMVIRLRMMMICLRMMVIDNFLFAIWARMIKVEDCRLNLGPSLLLFASVQQDYLNSCYVSSRSN